METYAGIHGSKEPSFPSTFRQTADLGKLYGSTLIRFNTRFAVCQPTLQVPKSACLSLDWHSMRPLIEDLNTGVQASSGSAYGRGQR